MRVFSLRTMNTINFLKVNPEKNISTNKVV